MGKRGARGARRGAGGGGLPRRRRTRAEPERKRTGTHAHAHAFVRALPLLLILIGLISALLTPPRFTAAPLFSAAPLVAAPFFGLFSTVLTGVAASGSVVLLQLYYGTVGRPQELTELINVVTVSGLAVLINFVVRQRGEKLASAREIAEAAQRAVLPEPAARIGGLQVAARYEAAQADAFIGGDLYAVQDTPHGVRLIVGDVRGKGLGAVEAVAVVIGAFREAAEQEATLEAVAQRLERALAREGTRRSGLDAFEGFTTAVLAEMPHGREVVRFINRGHPEPLLLSAGGRLCLLTAEEPALPLGMGDLGIWPDRAGECRFPGGATLLCYTDGLSEARDEAGEFYDPAARLSGRMFTTPDSLLGTVAEEVRAHTGGSGMTDDMALLAVRRPAAGEQLSPSVSEAPPSA
ncbi:PP2C family protein-serine/threonine phosphatase [Streptomyces cavernicola]|uniref:PP2C family protein-serine/threonine phosphatase n=1 Tax=Streptomyces cavernicola TaxID=3043613 RepID=A0ABT6S399_9ACTN|nr:PP2C family protein-serine/threonine phosphatase [Streptomyces sp. B-S-A6]MDI3402574.1 PP2C family protein-serine/threonine phosphatase [Streptomyces sp. B-S-A6]